MSLFENTAAQDQAEYDRIDAIIQEVKEDSNYPHSEKNTPAAKRPRKLFCEEDIESSSSESKDDSVDLMRIFFEDHDIDLVSRIALCRTYANYVAQCIKIQHK